MIPSFSYVSNISLCNFGLKQELHQRHFAMRVHYIVLLAVAIIAAANAQATHSGPRSLSDVQSHLTTTRHLRAHKSKTTNQAANEERVNLPGFSLKLGFIDDIIDHAKMGTEFKELLGKKASAQDALKGFKVSKMADDVLDTPQWKEWAAYVQYVAVQKKDAPEEALAAAMSVAYTPAGLSSLLAKAMQNSKTKDIAMTLEREQIKRWLKGGFTPDAIFKTLKLEKSDDIFNSPALATWTNFLNAYNKENPTKAVDKLEVFTTNYKEVALIKLLASADDNQAAVKLRDELVKSWVNDPTHPINMFKRFKLDEAGDDLFTSPLLSTWVQYMKAFNEKYPQAETTIVQTFTKSYGDEKLALMIQAAMKSDDTKMVEFATNLQTVQFKQWMADNKTPKEMLSVLKLNSQAFNDNPAAGVWRAYNKEYTKADGDFAFQP